MMNVHELPCSHTEVEQNGPPLTGRVQPQLDCTTAPERHEDQHVRKLLVHVQAQAACGMGRGKGCSKGLRWSQGARSRGDNSCLHCTWRLSLRQELIMCSTASCRPSPQDMKSRWSHVGWAISELLNNQAGARCKACMDAGDLPKFCLKCSRQPPSDAFIDPGAKKVKGAATPRGAEGL